MNTFVGSSKKKKKQFANTGRYPHSVKVEALKRNHKLWSLLPVILAYYDFGLPTAPKNLFHLASGDQGSKDADVQ